jgi:hypothetical protein
VEKFGLGVLHREPEVPESIKHNPIRLRKARDVPIEGLGLANYSAIIHIRKKVARQVRSPLNKQPHNRREIKG